MVVGEVEVVVGGVVVVVGGSSERMESNSEVSVVGEDMWRLVFMVRVVVVWVRVVKGGWGMVKDRPNVDSSRSRSRSASDAG